MHSFTLLLVKAGMWRYTCSSDNIMSKRRCDMIMTLSLRYDVRGCESAGVYAIIYVFRNYDYSCTNAIIISKRTTTDPILSTSDRFWPGHRDKLLLFSKTFCRHLLSLVAPEISSWQLPVPVTNVFVNTLGPRQNGRHIPDDIFKCIFLNESIWISIEISLKFVPKGPIYNIYSSIGSDNGLAPARRQAIIWTNAGLFTDAYMRHSTSMS